MEIPDKPGFKNGVFYLVDAELEYNEYWRISHRILSITVLIGIILLFICHVSRLIWFYKTSKKQYNMDSNDINAEDIANIFPLWSQKKEFGVTYYYIYFSHVLTILALVFGILNVIVVPIFYYVFNRLFISCSVSCKTSMFMYYFGRLCIVYTGILRIFITFHGSYLDYSSKFKKGLILTLVVLHGYLIISDPMFSKIYVVNTDKGPMCQYGFGFVNLLLASLSEAVTNVLLLILFIKPLIILIRNSDNIPESYVFSIYMCYSGSIHI